MALREFYAERFADAASEQNEGLLPLAPPSDESALFGSGIRRRQAVGVPPEDRWTLEHITLLRIQPLLEAFDDDASTFVTVTEVNTFTQARPRDWR